MTHPLSPSVRITAVRHGETAWNVDTRIQGQLDIAHNDRGEQLLGVAGATGWHRSL
ncbi:MAG: hypothetical protein RLZZ454_1411 [Pseudomonadota bacterium]